jgi:hypothetical protein
MALVPRISRPDVSRALRHYHHVRSMFRRPSIALVLPWVVACAVISGCGGTAAPSARLTPSQAQLKNQRVAVQNYASTFVADLRRAGLSPSPVAKGLYRSCSGHRGNVVSYEEAVIAWAGRPLTVATMSRGVSAILRSEGWTLVNVDFSEIHLAFGGTDHPLYDISQHGMWGAANILPFGSNSAGAMVFMHSRCINAEGSIHPSYGA